MTKGTYWSFSVVTAILIACLSLTRHACGTEIDLTFEVGPGKQECFWQKMTKGVECEVDYQVIDGGDNDINFLVISSDNTYIHADQQKTDNLVKFTPTLDGDYRFCFDNTFSRISPKVVFFELFTDDKDHDENQLDLSKITFEGENLKDEIDMTVKDFVGILDRAKTHLDRSIQVQTLLKMHEAKDRNTQESNFQRVNVFSLLQLGVMLAVGLIQVILIRSLFQDNKPASGSGLKQRT